MADMLARGAAWLASRQRDYASRSVSYVRSGVTYTLPAMVARTEWEQDVGDGVIVKTETADWIFPAAEFAAAGIGDPQRGDRVFDDSIAGRRLIYEVMPPGSGGSAEPCWRYTDRHRKQLRIYTKLIGNEAR